MYRLIAFLVILAIGGLVSLFTVSSKEVLTYNDHMVDTLNAMDQSFQQMTPYLDTYGSGESVDISAFTSTVDQAGQNISQHLTEVNATKVPDDQVCKDFHEALTKYANNNSAIHAIYVKDVIPYIEAHNPGKPEDVTTVQDFFADSIALDEVLLKTVQERQQTMAGKHNITLQ